MEENDVIEGIRAAAHRDKPELSWDQKSLWKTQIS